MLVVAAPVQGKGVASLPAIMALSDDGMKSIGVDGLAVVLGHADDARTNRFVVDRSYFGGLKPGEQINVFEFPKDEPLALHFDSTNYPATESNSLFVVLYHVNSHATNVFTDVLQYYFWAEVKIETANINGGLREGWYVYSGNRIARGKFYDWYVREHGIANEAEWKTFPFIDAEVEAGLELRKRWREARETGDPTRKVELLRTALNYTNNVCEAVRDDEFSDKVFWEVRKIGETEYLALLREILTWPQLKPGEYTDWQRKQISEMIQRSVEKQRKRRDHILGLVIPIVLFAVLFISILRRRARQSSNACS